MTLANMQEQKLLKDNMPFILKRVRAFHPMDKNPVVQFEDLMQEASIWFLKTARKDGADVARKKRIDLLGVLYRAVMDGYPLTCNPDAFMVKKEQEFISMSEVDETVCTSFDDVRDAETWMLLESLTSEEKRYVELKLEGRSNHEIAEMMHLSYHAIKALIRDLRKKAEEWR